MGTQRKSNYDFIKESIDRSVDRGNELAKIHPECVDSYDDHSLLKLICIQYWTAIFCPIIGKNVRAPMNYIDSMAGSGVTRTRNGILLCGSAPGVLQTAIEKKYPFHSVIAVEINPEKAKILEERLDAIKDGTKIVVVNDDIKNVSQSIAEEVSRTFCLVLIDPQAFQGITWKSIRPLLCLNGDAMINFFEGELYRMKEACLSKEDPPSAKSTGDRIDDILGTHDWIKCNDPEGLTDIFIDRVKRECGKDHHEVFKIYRSSSGNYYKMILFTSKRVEGPARAWKENMDRRLSKIDYDSLSTLLDIKDGKAASLDPFLGNEKV